MNTTKNIIFVTTAFCIVSVATFFFTKNFAAVSIISILGFSMCWWWLNKISRNVDDAVNLISNIRSFNATYLLVAPKWLNFWNDLTADNKKKFVAEFEYFIKKAKDKEFIRGFTLLLKNKGVQKIIIYNGAIKEFIKLALYNIDYEASSSTGYLAQIRNLHELRASWGRNKFPTIDALVLGELKMFVLKHKDWLKEFNSQLNVLSTDNQFESAIHLLAQERYKLINSFNEYKIIIPLAQEALQDTNTYLRTKMLPRTNPETAKNLLKKCPSGLLLTEEVALLERTKDMMVV